MSTASGGYDTWVLGALVLFAVLVVVGIALWLFRRRRQRNVERRLHDASCGILKNVLIPDGNGGHIHLEYVLLTRRGILILDIKDVEGHVFGSEGMQDWTVLANDRRYTFSNPQPGLWDRLAAVKRLTPEVPVTGHVAFGAKARFSKGQPRSVIMLEELLQDLEQESQADRSMAAESFRPYWERLCAAVGPTQDAATSGQAQA
jgi:hypothetical protein